MENTFENKERFFANYWKQQVLTFNDEYESTDTYLLDGSIDDYTKLLLKPLSSITDEDAIEVAKLLNISSYFIDGFKNRNIGLISFHKDSDYIVFYESFYRKVIDGEITDNNYPFIFSDYMRQNGYAIEWHLLSVEQQIEYNWIKLKTE